MAAGLLSSLTAKPFHSFHSSLHIFYLAPLFSPSLHYH
ncbi:hypothetical protein SLEP1_g44469 [Rubroshorea leprosula]|uniref:Uncharacterized protein n=1 Tax=Rubroshorea leprosula TaxID=152421 RepID=A0AAV5LG84_9ROSI|nr:hypothetical protein SLEP1_g44469 [Rubroshorea leprosula]